MRLLVAVKHEEAAAELLNPAPVDFHLLATEAEGREIADYQKVKLLKFLEGFGGAERAAGLLRSLDQLPQRQREVVYLRFYADDSLEGIAEALGCSVGTVKSRVFYGLRALRLALEERGVTT